MDDNPKSALYRLFKTVHVSEYYNWFNDVWGKYGLFENLSVEKSGEFGHSVKILGILMEV